MFAPKTRQSASNRREKPYARNQKPMARSNSLLGTIKNIVSAPLSWFASNQGDFEDLGKRRRVPSCDVSDIEEGHDERSGKRMRLDSPKHPPEHVRPSTTGGYLDPPPFSPHAAQPRNEEKVMQPRRTSILRGSLRPNNRMMSVDPPSRYSMFNRDPAMVPLPPGSPGRSSPARSVNLEDGLERPHTPFRLRTSLTPQPGKPVRRESSAPPPLSSLRSQPMFVKPPPKDKESNGGSDLASQKAISLGTLADMARSSRAPSRNRTLTGIGSMSGISDQLASSISSDATFQPAKSLPEKTFQELELYKTPILPSRYKDASVIPSFLKPKRSHVPIPMKKSRASKPSLGMASKHDKESVGVSTRDDGKPYAGKPGVKKMLDQRKAEAEEERRQRNAESTLTTVEETDEMDTDIELVVRKRDVGVSARMTSGSEDERARSRKADVASIMPTTIEAPAAPTSTVSDPFLRPLATTPGGRQQPYGRVGRTRTREPGQRSVPLSRPSNRFSAAFEGDSIDSVDESMKLDEDTPMERQQTEVEATRAPAYEAPKGFSFAGDTSVINHDHAKAKELPIPSLPFSLGVKTSGPTTGATDEPKEIPSLKSPASIFPNMQPSTDQGEKGKEKPAASAPAVSLVPPSPDQPLKETKATSAPPNFFAVPPTTSGESTPVATPKPSGVPNFFANSPLLAGDKPATSAPPKAPSPKPLVRATGAAVITPVKDPENPLWNGNDAAPGAPPKLFAQVAKPFTSGTGAKPQDESSAPKPLTAPAPLFGGHPKPSMTHETTGERQSNLSPAAPISAFAPSVPGASQTQHTPSKPSEPEKKSNGSGPSPFFNFGAGAASNVPKPLFGTGGATTSTNLFSAQPSQPSQNATGDTTQKPVFTFGLPQASSEGSKSPSTQPSQAPQVTTEQKSLFTFGAPSMSGAATHTSASAGNDTVTSPKPLFGAPSTGTGFTFGAPSTPAGSGTDAAKPTSPFAFGAAPATPPAGERQGSPFTFGTQVPSSAGSTGFTFGTPVKQNGAALGTGPLTPTNTSPFVFGAQPVRPVTPPPKPDDGMSMEESPVQMDTNGGQKRPASSITFGLGPTPVNPFVQNTSSGPAFTFGVPSTTLNSFAPKGDNKLSASDTGSDFNFNRTASAPAISTTFSFGAKSDVSTPPATAFGAPTNPFGQAQISGAMSSPFAFGQPSTAPTANPFGAPTQSSLPAAQGSAPSSPFQSTPAFTFGAPTGAPNPFAFGSSAPSSPATSATGLPQVGSTPSFTFGASGGSTGSSLFNIGAPPPNSGQGTPGRPMKKLPRRGHAKR